MRKFFIALFKFLIPLGIVAYPIIANLKWSVGGYIGAGAATLVFVYLWLKWFKKLYSDIVFKEQHERLIDKAIHFWTNLKYEASQIIRVAFLWGILNLINIYIADINKYILYIMISYFIGAVIKIRGSIEFQNN